CERGCVRGAADGGRASARESRRQSPAQAGARSRRCRGPRLRRLGRAADRLPRLIRSPSEAGVDRSPAGLGVRLEHSEPLRRIAPSTYEALRACRLRVAYSQAFPSAGRSSTPALRLGAAAHRVLDRFARERAFAKPLWDDWVDGAWMAAIDEERSASVA